MSVLRKFLIALTIFLFLVFLVAFILPRVIDLDKYKPTLISMVEERINGKVNLRHIELTILDGLGARLHDFEVLNADRFDNSPFLRVRQLEVKIGLLPLLAGKINSKLILEAPQILLEKDREGIFSFKELIREPGNIPNPPKAKSLPSSGVLPWIDRFSVSALSIKNGKITYIDHATQSPKPRTLTFEDLHLKVENLSLGKPIRFELAFREETFASERIRLEGKVRVDAEHNQVELLTTYLTTGDLELELGGKVDDYKVHPILELSISSNRFTLARLLSIYPPVARRIPPELSISGLSSLKGSINGDLDNLLIKGNIDCNKNTINYGDTFRKSEGVLANLALSLLIEKGSLRINELELNLNGLKLKGSGSMANLRDPKIDLKAATNEVELKGWEGIFPSSGLSRLAGGLRLEGAVEGSIKDRKGLSFKGRLLLNEVGASVPWLAQDVEGLNGELKFSSDSAIGKDVSLKLGNSDVNLDFELSDFENPKISFDLISKQLNMDEFLPKSLKKKTGGEKGQNPEAGKILLDRFTVQGNVRVASGKIKRLSFENLSLNLSFKNKLLTFSNLSFDLYGGSYQGTGKLDMGTEEPTYIFQSQLREVKINELLSRFPSLEGIFSGFLSAELSLSGKGISFESFSKSLSGAGKISLSKGRISSLSLEKSLSVLSKLEGWEGSSTSTEFQALEGQVSISEERVNTSGLRLRTGDMTVAASGYFDRNRQINYQAQAVLSRRLSQSLERSLGGEFFKDEGERIVIPFHLGGTIDSPEFSLNHKVLEKGRREWALRKTEAELNRVINKELNR